MGDNSRKKWRITDFAFVISGIVYQTPGISPFPAVFFSPRLQGKNPRPERRRSAGGREPNTKTASQAPSSITRSKRSFAPLQSATFQKAWMYSGRRFWYLR